MQMTKMSSILLLSAISALAAGCQINSSRNDGCQFSSQDRGCVINRGTYGPYRIGMTQQEAFDLACSRWNARSRNLFFEKDGIEVLRYGAAICDAEGEALAADKWTFVEDENDGRYVQLQFESSRLVKIVFMTRGGDS